MTTDADMFIAKFRCVCGTHDFHVRYRDRGEDLLQWMERVVTPGIQDAHNRLSPLCMSEKCDLMLPINKSAEGLGMRTNN